MNEQDLFNKMKQIEGEYLKPHAFAKFNNYWLPREIVEQSTNVLSFGVHRDVGWEQEMCELNPNLNIHCFDPTPDSVSLFESNFPHKDKMTFHQVAYMDTKGTAKFYYNKNDLTKCYSLVPLPQLGGGSDYIEVETNNLTNIMQEINMPEVDIIKADIEGVWFEICREILDNDINFLGKEKLIQIKKSGIKKKLMGVKINADKINLRSAINLTIDDKIIGEIRSACYSPTFKKVIGIAMIFNPYFLKKDQFNIIIDNNLHTGEICEIPFV